MKKDFVCKLMLVIIFLLVGLIGIPTMCHAQTSYKRDGNSFVSTSSRGSKAEPTKTKFTYTDSKGNTYPIYVSSTGSCFIIRTSKNTGKEYRSYLGPDISTQVCKELGIEYKRKPGANTNNKQ